MRKSRALGWTLLLAASSVVSAQVVSPVEISDPQMRGLQQSSLSQLKNIGQNIKDHKFDFPFYFSRKLDIDQKQQQRIDQHSIRFERYNGETVLAISGNYYGAYSTEKFSDELRARQTFLRVVLPIMKAAVPEVQNNPGVQGYAVEISHHVYGRTMGMPIERAENLMVYLPQSAAVKLVSAQDKLGQQAALLEAEVFLNANPLSLWLTDGERPPENDGPQFRVDPPATTAASSTTGTSKEPDRQETSSVVKTLLPVSAPAVAAVVAAPPRDSSPAALAVLQTSIQPISNRIVKELEPQAHFVAFAPPSVIAFRQQVYLEVSVSTMLSEPAGTSRYRLAALAFDNHISPLLRRVLGYIPSGENLDGISISTTVHGLAKASTSAVKPLSVEYFFPLQALHCYESYDCTGQQLIDAGTVLINGERVGLELQSAEARP